MQRIPGNVRRPSFVLGDQHPARVPVDLAGGAYDMGQADINPVIKFMAENPNSGLVMVGIWGDRSLLCCTTRADGPIRTPKDLEGRTLAAPESDAGRQLFPAFAKAAGVDATKITWMTVSPELREPMLVQRRADAITGAITSVGMSLKALGMDFPAQRTLMYRDHGLDLLGTCYLTTRTFAEQESMTMLGRWPPSSSKSSKSPFGIVHSSSRLAIPFSAW